MITTRDATAADLPALVDIYNQSIPAGTATADIRPITVESRQHWLAQFSPEKRPIWVAEDAEGQIIGCIYVTSFYAGRPAYDKTAEVSIYLANSHQNQGLGSFLLQKMIDACPALGITTLIGMHFDHNESTRHLNEKFGFEVCGHLPEIAEVRGQKRGLLISLLRIADSQ